MEGITRKLPKHVIFGYEFMGTAFLLFAINASRGDALGIGFTIFAMLLIGGPLTGGHYNPAVSIGVFFNEDNKGEIVGNFVTMLLAQFTGALFGVAMAWIGLAHLTHNGYGG